MSRNGFISSISSSFSRLLEEDIPKVLHENKKQQKKHQKKQKKNNNNKA